MSVDELKLLTDIENSIVSINEYLGGRRVFSEYLNSKIKRRAVERELSIIGEAMNSLLKINPSIPISYARIVVDLRNKIIHSYDNINNAIIWKIIVTDIPKLLTEVQKLLEGHSPDTVEP